MLLYLHTITATSCCSSFRIFSHSSPTPPLPTLRFHTAYHEKLSYLRNLGIVDSNHRNPNLPSHKCLNEILVITNYLKCQGFSESDISKLAFCCRKLFTSSLVPAEIEPVFRFLAKDVAATTKESCELVLCCPDLLFSNVEYCLRPTFTFLKDIGLKKLNSPNNLNAHLLNTRIGKLETKIVFLVSIGFTYEESVRACFRFPAIFGYSIECNLQPKVEFLLGGMQRSIDELKEFPQYFAFSLTRRIVPRHIHLKQRQIHISLKRMLVSSDQKFYDIWK